MLSKWLTEILVLLAVGLGVAWIYLWLHEHGICPLKAIKKIMCKMSLIGLCILALWAVPLIQYGSTKGENGGTNNVPQMVVGGGSFSYSHNSIYPQLHNFTFPITSTNTTRTLEAEDFERGFVMSRVGTDEAFDFSAPAGATVCSDWRAFGAATEANVKCKV